MVIRGLRILSSLIVGIHAVLRSRSLRTLASTTSRTATDFAVMTSGSAAIIVQVLVSELAGTRLRDIGGSLLCRPIVGSMDR